MSNKYQTEFNSTVIGLFIGLGIVMAMFIGPIILAGIAIILAAWFVIILLSKLGGVSTDTIEVIKEYINRPNFTPEQQVDVDRVIRERVAEARVLIPEMSERDLEYLHQGLVEKSEEWDYKEDVLPFLD